MAMNAHSKRVAIFKFIQAIGVAVAGFIGARFIDNAFLIISILSTIVFIICIGFVKKVKNFPKTNNEQKRNMFNKLNIFGYSKYFRKWFIIRFISSFALCSLIVLLSVKAIDSNLGTNALKISKSLLWMLSGLSFFFSNYFIRKKLIITGDILLKLITVILLMISFFIPQTIFLIILIYGVLEGFNTMSHLEMLRKDNDKINLTQKDMVINLARYIAKMLSAYILLNINTNISLIIISILLIVSTFFEYRLYKSSYI